MGTEWEGQNDDMFVLHCRVLWGAVNVRPQREGDWVPVRIVFIDPLVFGCKKINIYKGKSSKQFIHCWIFVRFSGTELSFQDLIS